MVKKKKIINFNPPITSGTLPYSLTWGEWASQNLQQINISYGTGAVANTNIYQVPANSYFFVTSSTLCITTITGLGRTSANVQMGLGGNYITAGSCSGFPDSNSFVCNYTNPIKISPNTQIILSTAGAGTFQIDITILGFLVQFPYS